MNKTEKVLWAVKKGEPDYCEQIITTNPNLIDKAIIWAQDNGFDRIRISNIDLSTKPNFVKTINKM